MASDGPHEKARRDFTVGRHEKVDRDRPGLVRPSRGVQNEIRRAGFVPGCRPVHYAMAGSSALTSQTELELSMDGLALSTTTPGVPVPQTITAVGAAISWVSDNDPGSSWLLTLQRKQPGESGFSDVAYIAVGTS